MSAAARVIRVVVADDQTLFRSGLARLLDEDPRIAVIGQAADGVEAVAQAMKLKPDLVLMDLKMPNMDGIEASRQILSQAPEVKIMILTTFEADNHLIQALEAGVSGYVLKDSALEAIITSILAVVAGGRVMGGSVADRFLGMVTGAAVPKEVFDGLTPREIDILKLLAAGLANKQIAFRLKISDKTVRNHVSNMYEKLKIADRSQAVLYAVRKGLIEV